MKVRIFSQQNRHPSKVAVLAIFLLIKVMLLLILMKNLIYAVFLHVICLSFFHAKGAHTADIIRRNVAMGKTESKRSTIPP